MPPPSLTGRQRILLNAFLAALMLRLLNLTDHSLWVDEGVTWWNATHGTWRDALFAESNHPPVWWLATRAWLEAFPGGEGALRFPAVLSGVLAVVLTYFLSRRLCDPERVPLRGGFLGRDPGTAAWVAVLAAVNPFWIEYAQEARMYALLLAECLGLSLLYLRWLDGGRRWTLVAYALLAALALYTQYFALWPIAGHAAHALWLWRRERGGARPFDPRPILVAQAVAGILFVPWFVVLVRGYRGIDPGSYEPFGRLAHALWRMGTGPALVALDRPRVEAGPVAVFLEQPGMVLGTAALWVAPIAMGIRALWKDPGGRAFVLACLAVPVALVLLACVRWPLVHEKYLIFVAPFLLYVAVLGARSAPGPWRAVLLGGLVLLHAAGLFAYHASGTPAGLALAGGHPYGKEQWREAHAWVEARAGRGDVVLLHAPFTRMTWQFYDGLRGGEMPIAGGARPDVEGRPVPPLDLPCDRALGPDELLARFPAIDGASQVFLVLSHEATPAPDHYRDALAQALLERWGGFRSEGPVLFPRQWGIRAYRFRR